MIFVNGDACQEYLGSLGGKASALVRLSREFTIPAFILLIPESENDCQVKPEDVSRIEQILGVGPFAVRSSANVEDQSDHSFAGMFETVLGVHLQNLQSAVQRVVDSSRSPRVTSYSSTVQPTAMSTLSMTVVIQNLVDADSAGVCLSRSRAGSDEIMIEAVLGIGETLVSGEVSPDRYIVDRQTLGVRTDYISCQAMARRLTRDGVIDVAIPPFDRRAKKLMDGEIREIAQLACRAEASLNLDACDIEWAFAQGALYLLQARPYAGLPE